MSDYVTLANSSGSLSKRFYLDEYRAPVRRNESQEKLSSGKTHVIRGRSETVYEVTFLTPETSNDADWGDLDDLETLHGYIMPGGTPSDILTLTLLDGTERKVRWLGDMTPVPQGRVLFGTTAWYAVRAELLDVTQDLLDFSSASYSMFLALI